MSLATKWRTVVALAGTLGALASASEPSPAPRPISLDEAVQIALEKNPDLLASQQRVAAARARFNQASAAFWPVLRLSGSYSASDNPVQAFMMSLNQRDFNFASTDFNEPGTTDNLNGRAQVLYSLYSGGRDQATRQAAKLGAEASRHQVQAARNELVFEVIRSFHNIAKARRFVDTAAAAVNSMQANLRLAQDRLAQNAALKTDTLDAEVNLAQAREDLVTARNALGLGEIYFRHVLGVGDQEQLTAAPVTLPDQPVAAPPSTNAPARELPARPELAAARKAVAAAEQQLKAARAGHRPRINAFAQYDLDSANGTDYANSWLAGVSLEITAFDGFLTRGQLAEARAQLELAHQQLRKIELGLELEVRQARLNLETAAARLETTAQTVRQADESLRLTKDRYTNGLALFTQVLDAETALTAARQRRAAAEVDHLIAQAALAKALGHLWRTAE